jgi:hypothetical protein
MTAQLDILRKNFVEGDQIPITFTFTNQDGSLYDFSTVTKAWFTVKANYDDDDSAALVGPLDSDTHPTQVTYGVAGPGDGKARVVMLPADTAGIATAPNRYYDFQVLKGTAISTLVRGSIKFVHEVTVAFT